MSKETKNADINAMSFEEAMTELEMIVQKLERADAKLDESIEIYERGAALKLFCETKLKEAEGKIEKIIIGEDGSLATEPFDDVE